MVVTEQIDAMRALGTDPMKNSSHRADRYGLHDVFPDIISDSSA